MNLTKHDPETDMEMDMTPMIDIVFQLIIFFMLISDMSQKELEVLVLPAAENATPDKPNPDDMRPVINIVADGSIYIKGEKFYDAEAPDEYKRVQQHLSLMASRMEKEPVNEDDPSSMKVPADAVLVRADQSTPFHHIQKIMEICGTQGIQIWKIQLAASESAGEEDAN